MSKVVITRILWRFDGSAPAIGALCAAAILTAAVPAQDLSRRALVAQASAYVADYQQQLTAVVADEEYTQEILEQSPLAPGAPHARRLRSEVFFVFEPVDRQWMAIRDTILVDGRAAADRRPVRQAFETLSPYEVGHRFSQSNARWNIGRIVRTFNEPTIGLLVFDRRHVDRFTFERRAVAQTPAGTLVTLEFRERERPTLVRGVSGGPVFSRGDVELEPDGRIRTTRFQAAVDDLRVELTTKYAFDAKLQMWLPSVFRERYERGRKGKRDHELIVCEALYTNYRRFDVITRVK